MATAALFLIVVFLWRDSANMKTEMLALANQNSQLNNKLTTAQTELDFFKTGDFRKPAEEKAVDVAPVIPAPIEVPETLLLQEPTVSQTADGLVARFGFKPTADTELPEQITLVVRVPGNAAAKILSLKPVTAPSYSNVEYIVDAKGKLGMIEGSPAELTALTFELTVSAPVKALVRGSAGIKAFELDISAEGCRVRQL